jgi:DNA-binding transcriptional regulator YdaS (Cro superfamily)
MNLSEYVKAERGRSAALASALGIAPELVSQWANDARRVPAERCPSIEAATGSAVRCEDLRPDIAWGVLREQATPNPRRPSE